MPSPDDHPAATTPGLSRRSLRRAAKVGVGVLLVVALIVFGRRLGAAIPLFAAALEDLGSWGPLLFVLGYVIATVAFVPGSLLTLAAGAVFGLFEGTVYVFVGASAGASAAFLVSRYAARRAIEQRLERRPRFKSIDRAVTRHGLKIVLLLRLSPVFPFNLLNYALGLTRVRFRDYLIGCVGMLPATFLYVYYGKALGSVAAVAAGVPIERGAEYWVVLGVGLAATLAVTAVVTRLARRALDQEIADV